MHSPAGRSARSRRCCTAPATVVLGDDDGTQRFEDGATGFSMRTSAQRPDLHVVKHRREEDGEGDHRFDKVLDVAKEQARGRQEDAEAAQQQQQQDQEGDPDEDR